MAKSDKVTVESRVHDVLRLLLAGAEFADILQFASKQGWDVGERQLRRYIEMANQRFAETTEGDRQQLLGRHLMQRRALYARAVKANDLRTALQVLRDEANLEGLYPPTKIAPTTPDGRHPYHSTFTGVTRRDRVLKLLAAEAHDDRTEKNLVDQASPYLVYRLPDTSFPIMLLNILAMSYVIEQLEALATVTNAMFCSSQEDPDGFWDDIGKCAAFAFRVRRDGWQLFTDELELGGVGDYLVRGNYHGQMLELYGDKVCDIAPTEQEVLESLARLGHEGGELATAEDRCDVWRKSIAQMSW